MKINKKNIVKLNLISIGGSSSTRFSEGARIGRYKWSSPPAIKMPMAYATDVDLTETHRGFWKGYGIRFFRGLR